MNANALVGATWSCPDQDLIAALETLERAGFHEAEIWAEGIHLDPRCSPDVERAMEWLGEHRLSVRSVHLPFDQVRPGATAEDRSRAWVDLCAQTLASAEALGARLAVAHPVLFADPTDSHEIAVERFVADADEIAAIASLRGVHLVLENMHTMRGPTLRTVSELQDAIARMTNPAGICVDTGHAVYNGYVDDGLVDQITSPGRLLANSHVHDSDSVGRDPHLAPGEGIIDWVAAFSGYRSIGYDGGFVLEVKGGADPVARLTHSRAQVLRAMSS